MLSARPLRTLAAVVALVLVAAACDGPTSRATFVNFADRYALFAITGAPANTPTALSFLGGSTVADANFNFDIAFDIVPGGETRLYPVRSLAGGLALGATRRVGLQLVPGTFEALREAPRNGYDTLGYKVVVPGTVVAVEVQDFATCQFSLGGFNLYAKLVVDSIQAANRRVYGRTVSDPNCGFRELMPDTIPER